MGRGELRVPAVVLGGHHVIGSETKLRPLILVHSHPSVVKVLKVLLRHLSVGLAEAALEPLTAVREGHERGHVGFAPHASHGSCLSQINHRNWILAIKGCCKWAHDESQGNSCLLLHVRIVGHAVHGGSHQAGSRVSLVSRQEMCCDQWWHFSFLIRAELLSLMGCSVIFHHLNWVGHVVRVEPLSPCSRLLHTSRVTLRTSHAPRGASHTPGLGRISWLTSWRHHTWPGLWRITWLWGHSWLLRNRWHTRLRWASIWLWGHPRIGRLWRHWSTHGMGRGPHRIWWHHVRLRGAAHGAWRSHSRLWGPS